MRPGESAVRGRRMKKQNTTFISCVALALPMLMIASSPASAEYSYQMIGPPGGLFPAAFGINNEIGRAHV